MFIQERTPAGGIRASQGTFSSYSFFFLVKPCLHPFELQISVQRLFLRHISLQKNVEQDKKARKNLTLLFKWNVFSS